MLAGGRGSRLGGAKALVPLAGRPLIAWPLEALCACLGDVAVVAKGDTALPPLPARVMLWREPSAPIHPLTGIVHALARAAGRAVLVCAVDLPLVCPAVVRRLAEAGAPGALAVIARDESGRSQPLLGRYEPGALPVLAAQAALRPDAPLRRALAPLRPRWLAVPSGSLTNVNDEVDLARAAAALARAGAGGGDAAPSPRARPL